MFHPDLPAGASRDKWCALKFVKFEYTSALLVAHAKIKSALQVHPIHDVLQIFRFHCYMHTSLLDHATISDVTHSKTFVNLPCYIFTVDTATVCA